MLSTEELLRKAVLDTTDFDGPNEAPLSIHQVTQFIELMQAEQVMLKDVRVVTSAANKWQESIVNFSSRIAKPGTEGSRLDNTAGYERVAPATDLVELSTVLIRGEVPVTDEVLEDNVAGSAFVGSLERTIADRFGIDIEELMVNGNTASGDVYLAQFEGWLEQTKNTGNSFDASSYAQDYQEILKQTLIKMPVRYLRGLTSTGRFYVPIRFEQKYRDILAARGTALGDETLEGARPLRYQGIPIVGVPSFDLGITAGSPDTGSILLCAKDNLYAGFHRHMKFETWRDPREGVTSFVVTARVDAKVAIPAAAVCAYTVDVEP